MTSKKALIIGATGLVGRELTKLLLADKEFGTVRAFLRTPTGLKDQKLEEITTDFTRLKEVEEKISGDVLFSCMGTTLSKAGSKEKQYQIDYTFQYEFAKLAASNGVQDYMLISAPGASPDSMFFYSRMKGELDEAVSRLPFRRIIFIRPSVLRGDRPESRTGEKWGGKIIDGLASFIPPLRKYRSISGKEVAEAMVRIYKEEKSGGSFALDDLHKRTD